MGRFNGINERIINAIEGLSFTIIVSISEKVEKPNAAICKLMEKLYLELNQFYKRVSVAGSIYKDTDFCEWDWESLDRRIPILKEILTVYKNYYCNVEERESLIDTAIILLEEIHASEEKELTKTEQIEEAIDFINNSVFMNAKACDSELWLSHLENKHDGNILYNRIPLPEQFDMQYKNNKTDNET